LDNAMKAGPRVNAQYNISAPESLAQRAATRVRRTMFETFMQVLQPRPQESVLDIGVTSDQTYDASNYFELLYPHKARITAAGIDDASFLETRYPGVRFVEADICAMQFADGEFDLVHSAAVWEHVGSRANQQRALSECLRVARRGVCLTTPNRWFPIELHTQMPVLHWLPHRVYRALYRRLGLGFFADEANLNLLTMRELKAMATVHPEWRFTWRTGRLLGWPSNLILFAERR
jgi:ubiquinone/menaquinone biosynthesis C-methylase UbiE